MLPRTTRATTGLIGRAPAKSLLTPLLHMMKAPLKTMHFVGRPILAAAGFFARVAFPSQSPFHPLTICNSLTIVDSQGMGKPSDLRQGNALDLLILMTIALEPKHGWAIAKRIQQISNFRRCRCSRDRQYSALHRLEFIKGD